MSRESLCLEPLDKSHLHRMYTFRNDPRVFQWCRQFEPLTKRQHYQWFESLHERADVKMYAVMLNKQLLGVCGLTSIDWVNRRAEFSLYIDPDGHGLGFGSTALDMLLRVGFNVLNLNLVWGESFDGNPAMKMFERIGFKREGTRRQFYYRKGKYVDAHLFSITKDDYDQLTIERIRDSTDRQSIPVVEAGAVEVIERLSGIIAFNSKET
jgi:ribosomal-protein-alanine N-acetyltransferase